MKSAYAWEALKGSTMLKETALAHLDHIHKRSDKHQLVVYNTLNWECSGEVEVFIDFETLPEGNPICIS